MALAAKDTNSNLFLSFILVLTCWLLDGCILRQEKVFRELYEKVRIIDSDNIDFLINTSDLEGDNRLNVATSSTLMLFYIPLSFVIWLVYVIFTKCSIVAGY